LSSRPSRNWLPHHPLLASLRPASTRRTILSAAPIGNDKESATATRERKYEQLMKATTLSLAPMMEYTDRHFRFLVRLVSSQTLLYTEMVAANALSHERANSIDRYREEHVGASPEEAQQNYNDAYLQRFLSQSGIYVPPAEGASVLQLGGSDPEQLRLATQTVSDLTARGKCDYTAMNLNCGCPSPKVAGKGCFGAALMDDPQLVAQLTTAMHEGSDGRVPITVKCRIGTDSQQAFNRAAYAQINQEEEYGRLCQFIETVAQPGIVTDFSVHARIAVLQKSFSPADNRKIPPLKYNYIQRLCRDYPEFTFSLNGGVETMTQIQNQFDACPELKGVMVGRAWAADPWSFAMADSKLYGLDDQESNLLPTRYDILQAYGKHADDEETRNDPGKIRRFMVKAISPLFAGEPNAKRYRIALDAIAGLPKKLRAQGKTLEGQPPLSELIMNCAMENLSEEVLYRSRQESHDMRAEEEQKRQQQKQEQSQSSSSSTSGTFVSLGTSSSGAPERSAVVQEWQERRKLESDGSYEKMLSSGGSVESAEDSSEVAPEPQLNSTTATM